MRGICRLNAGPMLVLHNVAAQRGSAAQTRFSVVDNVSCTPIWHWLMDYRALTVTLMGWDAGSVLLQPPLASWLMGFVECCSILQAAAPVMAVYGWHTSWFAACSGVSVGACWMLFGRKG